MAPRLELYFLEIDCSIQFGVKKKSVVLRLKFKFHVWIETSLDRNLRVFWLAISQFERRGEAGSRAALRRAPFRRPHAVVHEILGVGIEGALALSSIDGARRLGRVVVHTVIWLDNMAPTLASVDVIVGARDSRSLLGFAARKVREVAMRPWGKFSSLGSSPSVSLPSVNAGGGPVKASLCVGVANGLGGGKDAEVQGFSTKGFIRF